MLSLLGLPMLGNKMMVRGGGGMWGNLFVFFHVVAALLFLTLLFLAVVYLWKRIEMMDHEMGHHHNHK